MLISKIVRAVLMLAFVCVLCVVGATAQTTPVSPAQQDATRPPGTEQRQSVPVEARPVAPDPTAPPGTERRSPQAPPGQTLPVQDTLPAPSQVPASTTTTPATSADNPAASVVPSTALPGQESTDVGSKLLQPRKLPPLPSMSRLGVASDSMLPLSLNDAIRRALEHNNDIAVARDDVRFAETQLRAFQGLYEPVFALSPQLNNSVTPQASTLGGSGQTGTVSQTDIQWDQSATKFFERGGGQYQFFFNNNRSSTNSTFSQFNPVYSSSLGVTFTQPLLRNRSIDSNRRQIRIQRKRIAQSDADFRRITTDIIAQVQSAYWELVFALRQQQNELANLNLTRELFRQTEQRIVAGATAPLERAEVQTELANRESDVLLAAQNVSLAENSLKRLMLGDVLSVDWSTQLVPTDAPSFDETPINLTDALHEARSNRPELSRLRLQQDISEIDMKFYRNQLRPRVDLQSTLSTTGLAGTPVVATGSLSGTGSSSTGPIPLINGDPNTSASAFLLQQVNQLRAAQGLGPAVVPTLTPQTEAATVPRNLIGGYGQTLRNLIGLNTRNIVVGVRVELPWHNRTAEANLAGAQIQETQALSLLKAQEEIIEVEVRNAAQAVETARRRVLTARTARENAEVQLEGEQRLYQVGRSTTFLLFQRENQLAGARNLELRAETDYNKALADLQRATSTTLRANNIIVNGPPLP